MRLFVAVEIAPAVIPAALDLIEHLRTRAARLAARSRITWVTADRLHVTVRFIGQIDEQQADSIRGTLGSSLAVKPFDLAIAGAGTLPPRGAPRVVYAGLTYGRDQLVALERSVSERLARAGVGSEDRPFTPHLTLGRVREAAGLRPAPLLDGLRDTVVGVTPVDAITLFESRLSSRGPTYVVLQRTALQ